MRISAIEKLKASLGGYFWLPCPMCGKMFGGHEKGETMWNKKDIFSGKMTCADPACMKKVKKYNSPIEQQRETARVESLRIFMEVRGGK